MTHSAISKLQGGLIVSCQAGPESALHGPAFMSAMAHEAEQGGAVGLRVDGPTDITAVRQMTHLPIIGINKHKFDGYDPYITATFELAQEAVVAGADLLAIDATSRPRPQGISLVQLIGHIHQELNVPVIADVSTISEGIAAAEYGADIVATTMSGYTPYSRKAISNSPDFILLEELISAVHIPVIVEGRVTTPEQATKCFELGAYAVCIGGAITSPAAITRRFVEAINTTKIAKG